jgi:SOS response regulatory protein OraA/RecX
LKAVASDRVLVNLSIKELRQSTGKGTTSYCTELKQHKVDKTHIEELVKTCLVKIGSD